MVSFIFFNNDDNNNNSDKIGSLKRRNLVKKNPEKSKTWNWIKIKIKMKIKITVESESFVHSRDAPVQPPPDAFLQSVRQVPVVQSHCGRDPCRQRNRIRGANQNHVSDSYPRKTPLIHLFMFPVDGGRRKWESGIWFDLISPSLLSGFKSVKKKNLIWKIQNAKQVLKTYSHTLHVRGERWFDPSSGCVLVFLSVFLL